MDVLDDHAMEWNDTATGGSPPGAVWNTRFWRVLVDELLLHARRKEQGDIREDVQQDHGEQNGQTEDDRALHDVSE